MLSILHRNSISVVEIYHPWDNVERVCVSGQFDTEKCLLLAIKITQVK